MSRLKMWRVETRPSTDVQFWDMTDADKEYYQTTYKDTHVLISDQYSYSDNQLERTRTFWWNLTPGLIEVIGADEMLSDMVARNKLYDDLHGITRSDLSFEMYDEGGKLFSTGVFPNK